MSVATKHKNYNTLNLIGYGLSKFDKNFVKAYGFATKTAFYEHMVELGVAETTGVVKNRQDLFDGMIEGGSRKGWQQKGSIYKHRMDYIDSLFGEMDVVQFVEIVRLSVAECTNNSEAIKSIQKIKPIIKTRFKQMQVTGFEAESYFMRNYQSLKEFKEATLEDARLFGDGYDFQLTMSEDSFLVEVKGLSGIKGGIRLTSNEYEKAKEYPKSYALVVIYNLINIPAMSLIFDPLENLLFKRNSIKTEQFYYSSVERSWSQRYT